MYSLFVHSFGIKRELRLTVSATSPVNFHWMRSLTSVMTNILTVYEN